MKLNCSSILLSFTNYFIIVETSKSSQNKHKFLIISYKIIVQQHSKIRKSKREVQLICPQDQKRLENGMKIISISSFPRTGNSTVGRKWDLSSNTQATWNRNSPNDHVTCNKSTRLSRTSTHRFPVQRRRKG